MNNKKSILYFIMSLSVAFTLSLIVIRAFATQEHVFVFYIWNIFLAIIPFVLSFKIREQESFNFKSSLYLFTWLLFFPNAPYLVTDIFHFKDRIGMPMWFDLLIVVTAAWNGLLLGFVSILNIENYLLQFLNIKKVNTIVFFCFLLCGFGVYLGRFLRFNSWDVINNFDDLALSISHRFLHPFQHTNTWGFSILFSLMLLIFYRSIKVLRRI